MENTDKHGLKNAIRYTLYTFLLSTLVCVGYLQYSYPDSSYNIRVCVSKDRDAIELSIKGPYKINAINADLLLGRGVYLRKETVMHTNLGIKLGSKEFKIYGIRIVPRNDATIFIDGRHF